MKSLRQVWAAAQRPPIYQRKTIVSEQAAKRPTIETGCFRKAGIHTQSWTELPGFRSAGFQMQNHKETINKKAAFRKGKAAFFTVRKQTLAPLGRREQGA